jgi:hypothetical protein
MVEDDEIDLGAMAVEDVELLACTDNKAARWVMLGHD